MSGPPTSAPTGPAGGAPASGTNALILVPSDGRVERQSVADLSGVDLTTANALAVTYGEDAEAWLNDWYDDVGGPATTMAVLSPGEFTRSTAATSAPSTQTLPGWGTVEAFDDATDFAYLGRRTREFLRRWAVTANQTVLTFETVSDLLDLVDCRTAFRFLHLYTRLTRATGAHCWFHLDPAATEERTVRTLSPLFDETLAYHDGTWVRS